MYQEELDKMKQSYEKQFSIQKSIITQKESEIDELRYRIEQDKEIIDSQAHEMRTLKNDISNLNKEIKKLSERQQIQEEEKLSNSNKKEFSFVSYHEDFEQGTGNQLVNTDEFNETKTQLKVAMKALKVLKKENGNLKDENAEMKQSLDDLMKSYEANLEKTRMLVRQAERVKEAEFKKYLTFNLQ